MFGALTIKLEVISEKTLNGKLVTIDRIHCKMGEAQEKFSKWGERNPHIPRHALHPTWQSEVQFVD